MISRSSGAIDVRRFVAFVAALVVALLMAPSAHADHLPDGVSVDPHPAFGVPDPVGSPGAGVRGLNLPLPGVLPSAPDIIPIMPTQSALLPVGLPAIFIDTHTIPGYVLYRFDAVLGNIGGAMDLYCANCDLPSQVLWQVVWNGGTPPGVQNPAFAPVDNELNEWRNLTARGAFEIYSDLIGHNHWHYDTAAIYEFLVPGSASRRTAKIGFCMYDTYDVDSNTNYYTSSALGWCMAGQPGANLVRMGISPGIGDYYSAQLTDQWIDVTGLDAGQYTLRAEVNPQRFIDESDTTNNVKTFERMIPGATATSTTHSIAPGGSVTADLSGAVVAPEIPARLGDYCSVWTVSCYIDGTGATPVNAGDGVATLTFTITSGPQHGTVTSPLTPTASTTATLGYTAPPGFIGIDTITYTTTDERGLTSNPATITIVAGTGPANTDAPTLSGSAVVGETITGSPGSWTGDGTITTSHQWQRCDASGSACTDVPGATAVAYRVSSGDVGSTLRLVVTASNPVDSLAAASTTTSVVTALRRVQDPKSKLSRSLIIGSPFADFLPGTSDHEVFKALGGPDRIQARGGSDVAYGGKGPDVLKLGNGADTGYGGKGPDVLKLGNGADTGYGGAGPDLLIGGNGPDKLWAGRGKDMLKVRDGKRDVVNCGPGEDTVIADAKDVIRANCEIVKLPRSSASVT